MRRDCRVAPQSTAMTKLYTQGDVRDSMGNMVRDVKINLIWQS